ncbi:MAG: DUF3352 domain-containing protein [Candidatus Brocadiia bacterium]
MARTALALLALLCSHAAHAAEAADLARAVPSDALVYVEVADPQGLWRDFERSGLRAMARSVPPVELAFRMLCGRVKGTSLHHLGLPWDEVMGRYGSRFALVVLDVPGAGPPPLCVLLDASATRDELAAALRNTVEPTLRRNHPDAAFADELHHEVALRVLEAGGRSAAYAFLDDVLVAGPAGAVKGLITRRARGLLAREPGLAAMRAELAAPRGVFACLNVRRLLEIHREWLRARAELARQLDDLGVTGIQWLGVASAFDGPAVRERLYLYTGERRLGLMRLLGSLTPGASGAGRVLPQTCPVVLSLSFKDGPELWREVVAHLERGGEVERLARVDAARESVYLRAGLRFDEDVVGALGGEVFAAGHLAAVVATAKRGGRVGATNALPILGVRVADPEKLRAAVHRFLASQPVFRGSERQGESYRGTEVHSLVLPGRTVRPAYAFVGDYLLFARSQALLKECVDAAADGLTLDRVPRYKVPRSQLPDACVAAAYVDLQGLSLALAGPAAEEGPIAPDGFLPLLKQLGGLHAMVVPRDDGALVEARSRPGLLGLASLAVLAWRQQPPPAVRELRPPAPPAGDGGR